MYFGNLRNTIPRRDNRRCVTVFQPSLGTSWYFHNADSISDHVTRMQVIRNFVEKDLTGFNKNIYKHPVEGLYWNGPPRHWSGNRITSPPLRPQQFVAEFRKCDPWRFSLDQQINHLRHVSRSNNIEQFIHSLENEVMYYISRGIDRHDLYALIHPNLFEEYLEMPLPPCGHLEATFYGIKIVVECNLEKPIVVVERDRYARRGNISGRFGGLHNLREDAIRYRRSAHYIAEMSREIERYAFQNNRSYHFESKDFFKRGKLDSDYTGRKFWVKDICSSFDAMKLYKQVKDSSNEWDEIMKRHCCLNYQGPTQITKKYSSVFDERVSQLNNAGWM